MSDEAIIERLLDTWAAAVRSHDLAGVIRDHADDIRLFDVVPPAESRGLDAYRASWEQFFPWMGRDGGFELSEISVTAGDRVAFASAIIHCAGHEQDRRVALVVRLSVGLEKRERGWTVVHEHHSEPVQPQGIALPAEAQNSLEEATTKP